MAATVEICESNGAGEDITHNIINSNMGSADEANLDAVLNPIAPGSRSFTKKQRLHVTDMGGSSVIEDIRVWRTGDLGSSNASHKTNARTLSYTAVSYSTPTDQAEAGVDQDMPTTLPIDSNIGIGGSRSGQITTPGYSDYIIHQIVTDASDTAGSTSTLSIQYNEIA